MTFSYRPAATALLLALSCAAQAAAPETAPSQRMLQASNKALVASFYQQVFNDHDLGATLRLLRPDYIQHNPNIATGRQAFIDRFTVIFQQAPQSHTDIVRMSADGDLVWAHTHQRSTPDALGQEIIDVYRIQGGKIAEHWDSVVPVSATPANPNTQF